MRFIILAALFTGSYVQALIEVPHFSFNRDLALEYHQIENTRYDLARLINKSDRGLNIYDLAYTKHEMDRVISINDEVLQTNGIRTHVQIKYSNPILLVRFDPKRMATSINPYHGHFMMTDEVRSQVRELEKFAKEYSISELFHLFDTRIEWKKP